MSIEEDHLALAEQHIAIGHKIAVEDKYLRNSSHMRDRAHELHRLPTMGA